ncbi:hypothetical protein [Leeuwenhoekiella sp. NPDC079379]|uniref:hypothetical protein n=1 Tax=Leeuwenhoekiella sp. NPDC079379 TaxID=3364122 RepID=UPI0037C520A1
MSLEDNLNSSNHYQNSALYKKATEILKLANRIAEIAAAYETNSGEQLDQEILRSQALYIREDASVIPSKIAGAFNCDLYDIKMEKACLIRKSAQDLATHMTGLEMYGFKETEYLDLLRNEIEAFRILFAEWVKTFDPFNYIIDRWGLFNPPGVNYNDPDVDNDEPFDPDDFNFED